MAKVNWLEARRWFVHGGTDVSHTGQPNKATGKMDYPTFQQIADFYGVTIQTICAKNKKENWHDRQQQAQEELDVKLSKRLSELGVKSLSEVNSETFKLGDAVLATFTKQLRDGKGTIYAGDALAWANKRQEISEKASGVDNDDGDPVKAYQRIIESIKKGD